MLYSQWVNSYDGEKVKVIFLKDFTHRLDESKVIHFGKDSLYTLPLELAETLIKEKVCTLAVVQ